MAYGSAKPAVEQAVLEALILHGIGGGRGTAPRPPAPHLGIGIAGRQPGRFLDIALRREDLERMTPDGPERPHESEVEQDRGLARVKRGDRVQHAIDHRSSHGSLRRTGPIEQGGEAFRPPAEEVAGRPSMQWGMHSELRGSPARQLAKPNGVTREEQPREVVEILFGEHAFIDDALDEGTRTELPPPAGAQQQGRDESARLPLAVVLRKQ